MVRRLMRLTVTLQCFITKVGTSGTFCYYCIGDYCLNSKFNKFIVFDQIFSKSNTVFNLTNYRSIIKFTVGM